MDDTDNRILFNMLRNPRGRLSDLSEGTQLSEQDVHYRLKRIRENSILERYMLHVNPKIYGNQAFYMAFATDTEYPGQVDAVIRCFEKLTVFGISGTENELTKKIGEMKSYLGNPVMEYSPKQDSVPLQLSALDSFILKVLSRDPMTPAATIAREAEKRVKQIESRLDYMERHNVYSIIPKINLSKVNLVLVAFFSNNVEEITDSIDQDLVLIQDSISGLVLIFEQNLMNAKSIVNKIKRVDSGLDVMLVYDYNFFK
ncbi:MAG: hypothetical protein RE471_06955 [Ferroplasma sp.]|uniref:hypothetical protein n=1 Tax=Ferroplasma sp. TaxID=2591003 RepID=UPI0028153A01|nr:hypothetical protein [Ferroplasma sp.]WMT50712.1 MAG: hypothetical protein RE471_06955 [Ferroplasma sp.]